MFTELIKWSHSEHRNLPWRKKRTLYRTLVSEFMLQQTTVGAVLSHFEPFLKIYPDVSSLALASEEEILVAWKGLGYYRRAKNLRKAAIDITEFYRGEIPTQYEQLVNISGIGDYTASAILSIGLNQSFFAIDANIERVLSRLFCVEEEKGIKLHRKIKEDQKLTHFLTQWGGQKLNEALMDLGRIYCRAKKVDCENCPVQKSCLGHKRGGPLKYPIDLQKKKEVMQELDLLRVVARKGNKIVVYQKNEKEWLSGQWEIPTFIIQTLDKKFTQYPSLGKKSLAEINFQKLNDFRSSITKYKICNRVLQMPYREFMQIAEALSFKRYQLVDSEEIYNHLSTTSSKIVDKY